MDPDSVAKAFVEHYYTTFDANRTGLANLYQEGSMLTFEGQKIQGSQNIVAKLTSLPFQQCQHSITTVDCQPSGPAGGMLVFVSGNLQLAGEQHALKFSQLQMCVNNCLQKEGSYPVPCLIGLLLPRICFRFSLFYSFDVILAPNQYLWSSFCSQMFHLMPTPQGSFYVLNDIFRLNYA
ncbi:hypothetical protein WN943_020258 [Citrus x changshan-huyou]